MITIRSGRGVGDSLYLRPIVDYLVRSGSTVTALSDYPAIFDGSGATVRPFTRQFPGTVVAHYTHTMDDQSRTQFADMLRGVKITDDVPLRFEWKVKNLELVDRIKRQAAGRPLILVHGGREPFQRNNDGFGRDLMPSPFAFEVALLALKDCYRVRIGNARHSYLMPANIDLNGETSISDLLDLATVCDGVIAQCSFAIPLAECFGKPLLAIWASKGLKSATDYLRLISPRKVLHNETSGYVMDDWSVAQISVAARGLVNVKEMACAS